MDREVHEALYGKYDRIFRACANSVYQAYPQGEGPGDEAKTHVDTLVSLTTQSGNDTSHKNLQFNAILLTLVCGVPVMQPSMQINKYRTESWSTPPSSTLLL